jgi:hypothetical protein
MYWKVYLSEEMTVCGIQDLDQTNVLIYLSREVLKRKTLKASKLKKF